MLATAIECEPIGPPLTAEDDRWTTVMRRDPTADRSFYYGILTTGVYCRPPIGRRGAMAAMPWLLAGLAGIALATPPRLAAAGGGSDTKAKPETPERTVKERLSSKASDEQRVDNCKVPVELRGPKPRPDDCRHGARTPPTQ